MQSGSGVMSTLLWRTAASAAATRASSIQYGRIVFVWFLELWMLLWSYSSRKVTKKTWDERELYTMS